MNYHKVAGRGKWIIEQSHMAELSKADEKRSRVVLFWKREARIINARGRIETVYENKTETFLVNGHGKRAIENICHLIESGCFSRSA